MSLRTRLRPLAWLVRHPVTRQHPLRTLFRWVGWQCRKRVTPRSKIIPFVNGTRLELSRQSPITGCWYVVLPDYEEMLFLLRCLRAGDVFFDVGANVGVFSILAASRSCDVVAFEPIGLSYRMLQQNIALNQGFGSVLAENLAVGSTAGHLRMTRDLNTGNRVIQDTELIEGVEVPVTTLDDYCHNRATPNFIKLDVEGHELEVLLGAKNVLSNPRLLGLLIETFRPHNSATVALQDLERILIEAGFRPFEYEPHKRELRPLVELTAGSNNTLYLRDVLEVESRLAATCDKISTSAAFLDALTA